ncbi:MAG: 50S ribosomal protein L22 [Candidatus Taylorbacteria bacterium]
MITASLKNYRIAPRKVRLVADMIRGKSVIQAENILVGAVKKATNPLGDLLASAVANASHNFKIEKDALFVKEIRVDQGYVLKRSQPMARGSAFPIKKRTSHVTLTLAPIEAKVKKQAGKNKKQGEESKAKAAKVAKK